jgi:CheY-like chemotaxis protein
LRVLIVDNEDRAVLFTGLLRMDGYELARQLRSAQPIPHLRSIAITGYGEEKDHGY